MPYPAVRARSSSHGDFCGLVEKIKSLTGALSDDEDLRYVFGQRLLNTKRLYLTE